MSEKQETNNKKRGLAVLIPFAVIDVILLIVGIVLISISIYGVKHPKSAYDLAVENGFSGSETEWLESLRGEDGIDGIDGVDGTNGVNAEPVTPCNHAFGIPTVAGQSEDGLFWIVKEICSIENCEHYITRMVSKDSSVASFEFEASNGEDLAAMLAVSDFVRIADNADITLKEDIFASGQIRIDGKASLDLNGCALVSSYPGVFIKNYGTLTVDDGGENGAIYTTNVDAQTRDSLVNFGTITINGGTFGSSVSRGRGFVNYGTATVNGGNFTACDNYTNGGYAYAIVNGSSMYNNAAMTVNDATVSGKMNGVIAVDGGTMTVKGGNFSLGDGTTKNNFYMAYASMGTMIIEGGTFTRNVNNNHGFFYTDGGFIDIVGGEFVDVVNSDITISGSYITKISANQSATFFVKNTRIAVKTGVSVNYSETQTELSDFDFPLQGYEVYSNDLTSDSYYYWDTESGEPVGVYSKASSVLAGDGLWDGEYLDLVKNVILASDVKVQLASGSFYLNLGEFSIEGGRIVISAGVSVVCDKECDAIAAAEGCSLSVSEKDGKFVYSVTAEQTE